MLALSFQFCVPNNPEIKNIRLRAEVNLSKLRSGRNIAGMVRELELYAAPTDTTSGLPTLGSGGQLSKPGVSRFRPTLYKYNTLIERAKQLAQLALQMEAAMLLTLEKLYAGKYDLLKARQDLKLAKANVQLQNIKITEANESVKLAELQRDRAQIQLQKYQEWIQVGLNEWEQAIIQSFRDAKKAQLQSAALDTSASIQMAYTTAAAGGATGAAAAATFATIVAGIRSAELESNKNVIAARSDAEVNSIQASFERKKQEWQLMESLANQDIAIGSQQVIMANEHIKFSEQEKLIAELQTTNIKDTIEFLTTKFPDVKLYDWMSGILERVYNYFLQQATAIASLALNQLAFQRQETPPTYIRADYWQTTSEGATGDSNSNTPDRKGLTGSARLLQDIYQLDQYAFTTNQRKIQIVKIISLAHTTPAEFQRFRETGVMTFVTPMEMFDRDFPGHYLRLIKSVRMSVIALIPPIEGIHATLTTTGLSRVVIGPEIFQTILIRRDPETIALCSPINATGILELDPQQNEMLFPFEGIGVDTTWGLQMPQASNNFDFRTINDVLMTIEYTALNSFDYRQQVIQTLNPNVSAEARFSFQNRFQDQWYDLHNSEQTKTPMTIRFSTFREDFLSKGKNLKIQAILLYFVRSDNTSFDLPITQLRFTDKENQGTVGGNATPIDGKISTRGGNGSSWNSLIGKSPFGDWELTLPNTEEVRNLFKQEEIEDILLVVTYSARTPEWPS